MSLDTAVRRFQRRQAAVFRDTATITRLGEGGILNPDTGVWTPVAVTTVYDGPCLLRSFTWQGTDVQSGDVEVRLRGVRAKFPVNTDIQMDDIVIPTASKYDPSLIDISFRVTDVARDGWQISRWTICEEIVEGHT